MVVARVANFAEPKVLIAEITDGEAPLCILELDLWRPATPPTLRFDQLAKMAVTERTESLFAVRHMHDSFGLARDV